MGFCIDPPDEDSFLNQLPDPFLDDPIPFELVPPASAMNDLVHSGARQPAGPGLLGLCPIESVTIQGRMLGFPEVSYSVQEEVIHLSASSSIDHEHWVMIRITAEQLGEMLAAVLATRPNTEPAAYDVVRALVQRAKT